jgi:hypothetical protein
LYQYRSGVNAQQWPRASPPSKKPITLGIDGLAESRAHQYPSPGELNRGFENLMEGPAAPSFQQCRPRAHQPRNCNARPIVLTDRIHLEPGCRSRTVHRDHIAAGLTNQEESVSAEAAGVGHDDAESGMRRNRGINRAAAIRDQ